MSMTIQVADHLVAGLNLTEDQIKFALALGFYIDDRVSLGKAAELAGISKSAFLDELGKRRIPVRYDLEDLANDLKTIAAIQKP